VFVAAGREGLWFLLQCVVLLLTVSIANLMLTGVLDFAVALSAGLLYRNTSAVWLPCCVRCWVLLWQYVAPLLLGSVVAAGVVLCCGNV
jgi:hypothetical protein